MTSLFTSALTMFLFVTLRGQARRVLARIFPPRLVVNLTPYERQELVATRRITRVYQPLIVLAAFFSSAAGLFIILRAIAAWRWSRLSSGLALMVPSSDIWIWPAPFLGLFSFLTVTAVYRGVFGTNSESDEEIVSQASLGFDFRKATNFLAPPALLLILAVCVMQMNWYFRMDEETIAVKPFLSLKESIYSYRAVRQIAIVRYVRNPFGAVGERPRVIVEFSDGRRWCNEDQHLSWQRSLAPIGILLRKTGIKPAQVNFMEDLEETPGKSTPAHVL